MTPGFKPFKKLIDEQILPDSGLACVQPPGEGGGRGGDSERRGDARRLA